MKQNNMKSGKKLYQKGIIVCFLFIFLLSGIGLKWNQADAFLSCVENSISISKDGDVLFIEQPHQILTEDFNLNQQTLSRLDTISSQKGLSEQKSQRIIFTMLFYALLLGVVVFLRFRITELLTTPTRTQQYILSYIQKKDGKKIFS